MLLNTRAVAAYTLPGTPSKSKAGSAGPSPSLTLDLGFRTLRLRRSHAQLRNQLRKLKRWNNRPRRRNPTLRRFPAVRMRSVAARRNRRVKALGWRLSNDSASCWMPPWNWNPKLAAAVFFASSCRVTIPSIEAEREYDLRRHRSLAQSSDRPQARNYSFFGAPCWSKNLSAIAPCVAAPPARSAAAINDASTTSSRVAPAACAALACASI